MPHHPPHHNVPPSAHKHSWGGWQPPLPEDLDREFLETLLGDPDLARSVFRLFESCPPEVAAVGCLVLRLSNQIESLKDQFSTLKNKP